MTNDQGQRSKAKVSAAITLQLDNLTTEVNTKLAVSVRSLSVTTDSALSFNEHTDGVCKSSYVHLTALRHMWNHINEDMANTIACAMIQGRLDYCNSVLYGTSSINLNI